MYLGKLQNTTIHFELCCHQMPVNPAPGLSLGLGGNRDPNVHSTTSSARQPSRLAIRHQLRLLSSRLLSRRQTAAPPPPQPTASEPALVSRPATAADTDSRGSPADADISVSSGGCFPRPGRRPSIAGRATAGPAGLRQASRPTDPPHRRWSHSSENRGRRRRRRSPSSSGLSEWSDSEPSRSAGEPSPSRRPEQRSHKRPRKSGSRGHPT